MTRRSPRTPTRVALAAALTTAVATAVGTAAAADFSLRAVANSDENDEDHDGLVVFKDFVESRSNGAVEVELFIGKQPCADGTECLRALEDGSVDVYVSTSGDAANVYPYVQVLDLPYILTDDRVAEEVLSGNLTRELRRQILADSGNLVRLMTIGNTGGWRNFANTKRTVATPEDIEGMKIRTAVADLPRELVEALGASPIPIPRPELFASFRTGVVEGSESGIADIVSMEFPEAGLKYLTLDGHAYVGALWYMNNEVFMSMPEDVRRVVVDGFEALQQATFASPKRKSIRAYADFADAGGELHVPSPEEKRAFRAAAEPVHDWFAENVEGGRRWLDLLRSEADRAVAANEAAYEMDLN